jgi:sulfofructose kinase
MTRPDIIGVGCCVLDELLLLDSYPTVGAEGAVSVRDYSLQGGGPAATAMATAARLGAKTGLIARVGDDDRGRRLAKELRQAGVDVSRLAFTAGARSTLSGVCVHRPTGQRSFLMHSDARTGLRVEDVDRDYLAGAKVVLLDSFAPAALAAARCAADAGAKIVFDAAGGGGDRATMEEFLSLIDVMIGAEDFGRGFLGRDDPAAAADAIRRAGPEVAIITAGAEGAYVAAAEGASHQPAFDVQVVDTTGAGDVFHGAFAAAMLEGWELPRSVTFASATAAIICRSLGGRAGLPTRDQVLAFLAERGAR